MLVACYSLTQVYGAELWVIFTAACAVPYLAVCFLPRGGRGKKRAAAAGLLAAELVCDGVWAALFYPGGEYRNYGLGGSYMLLLIWPGLLLLAGLIVTAINRTR